MKSSALITLVAAAVATWTLPVQGWGQQQTNTQDPTAVMEQLLRWQMEDVTRRRADEQKERIRKEQEEAYDRQLCLKAGFRGPDVEQCVRDSGIYRRNGNDFSAYGTPVQGPRSRPAVECVTLGDGEGGGITDCY